MSSVVDKRKDSRKEGVLKNQESSLEKVPRDHNQRTSGTTKQAKKRRECSDRNGGKGPTFYALTMWRTKGGGGGGERGRS